MAQQQAVIPQRAKFESPNHFVLTGKREGKTIRVTYDSDSITGNPILTYTYNGKDQTFTGNGIKTQDIGIGMLVSVLLNRSTTFALLLPRFSKKESTFKTAAITAFAPMEVDQKYKLDELQGKAQEVQYLAKRKRFGT